MRMLVPLLLVATLGACTQQPLAPTKDDSLYQALGGQPGIERIVEGMLINISDNPKIVHHFAETDIDRLYQMLVEQFCFESGGPCEYTGDSMADSHAGMDVSEADFNALVEDLIAAMDAEAVPVATQNRLLARLAPMRADIIYR